VLLAQQRRDQKAAQREEHVDAQEAARNPRRVISEDREHGDAAETIEGGPIAELGGFGATRHACEIGKKLASLLTHEIRQLRAPAISRVSGSIPALAISTRGPLHAAPGWNLETRVPPC